MRNVKDFAKLNFGCGNDIRKDFWNIDIVKTESSDQNFNFDFFPYNLPHNHFEYIICDNVLEHLIDIVPVMEELFLLLKEGGILEIVVPYWTSANTWVHPQHKRGFSYKTFDYYVSGTKLNKIDSHWTKVRFKKIEKHLSFFKKGFFWNYPIEWFMNINKYTSFLYEYTFLKAAFPGDEIRYKLYK